MTDDDSLKSFRETVQTVADCLGGSEHVWEAVATSFNDALRDIIAGRLQIARHAIPWNVHYLMADHTDFHHATCRGTAMFKNMTSQSAPPVAWSAQWGKALLTQRGDQVLLEGGGFAMGVTMAGEPFQKRDRTGAVKEEWQVFLTDFGKRCLGTTMFSKPTSTVARSADGATRSVIKMAETFFGVTMAPHSTPAATDAAG